MPVHSNGLTTTTFDTVTVLVKSSAMGNAVSPTALAVKSYTCTETVTVTVPAGETGMTNVQAATSPTGIASTKPNINTTSSRPPKAEMPRPTTTSAQQQAATMKMSVSPTALMVPTRAMTQGVCATITMTVTARAMAQTTVNTMMTMPMGGTKTMSAGPAMASTKTMSAGPALASTKTMSAGPALASTNGGKKGREVEGRGGMVWAVVVPAVLALW